MNYVLTTHIQILPSSQLLSYLPTTPILERIGYQGEFQKTVLGFIHNCSKGVFQWMVHQWLFGSL